MIKSIPFLGLSTNPNDTTSTDGNLASAINLHHDRGSLVPSSITAPQLLMSLPDSYSVIYQHYNDGYRHLIISHTSGSSTTYYWLDCTSSIPSQLPVSSLVPFLIDNDGDEEELCNCNQVIAVGNTIIFFDNNEKYYFLFKSGSYSFLGTSIPEVNIDFRLYGDFLKREYQASIPEGIVSFVTGSYALNCFIQDSQQGAVDEAVLGLANKFVNQQYNLGKFTQPFLVRYAYRMYDGTITMHSSPVLMVPTTGAPNIAVSTIYPDSSVTITASGMSSYLQYYFDNIPDLSKWNDIVKSIDIFVSRQFCTYNQSGNNCTFSGDISASNTTNEEWDSTRRYTIKDKSKTFGSLVTNNDKTISYITSYSSSTGVDKGYGYFNLGSVIYPYSGEPYYFYYYPNDNQKYIYFSNTRELFGFNLPMLDSDTFIDGIKNCAEFFLLHSIPVEDVKNKEWSSGIYEATTITPSLGYLPSIVSHEQMTDDYDSHNKLIPQSLCVYNNRLNMANIVSSMYLGPELSAATCYTGQLRSAAGCQYKLYAKITTSNGNYFLGTQNVSQLMSNHPFFYLFFPNIDVEELHIYKYNTHGFYKKIFKAASHNSLNGSVFFNGFTDITWVSATGWPDSQVSTSAKYLIQNSVYTSEVGNPWVFRAANIEQVGNGRIIALAPLALALSQQQFGSYPMAVFTTDGVWALQPNQTGGWASVKPFTRDVLLNENAQNILQLDREIIFATSRGLLVMSPSADGVQCQCITDVFDGMPDSFSVITSSSTAGNGYQYIATNLLAGTDLTLSSELLCPSFKQFISNCRMLWDSTHQRIIVSNPAYQFCFVFNMADKLWTSIPLQVLHNVNSYPQCFAQLKHNLGNYCDANITKSRGMLSEAPSCTIKRQTAAGVYVVFNLSSKDLEDDASNLFYAESSQITEQDQNIRWGAEFFIAKNKKYWFQYMDVLDSWSLQTTVSVASPVDHIKNELVDFSRSFGALTAPVITTQSDATAAASAIGLPATGLIVTRPFHIDDATVYKTINKLFSRGQFATTAVKQVLLGSRDLRNWFVISAAKGSKLSHMHGTPYQHFRLVIVTSLSADDYLLRFDTEYINKFTDTLR